MWDEIKGIKSGEKELKSFGLLVGSIALLIGMYMWWKQKSAYPVCIITGSLLVIPGIVMPKMLLPFQKVWMSLAVVMGWIVTRVILIVLFYGVVTPIALIARMVGKDFLDMRIQKDKKSYWKLRRKGIIPKSQYEKQF